MARDDVQVTGHVFVVRSHLEGIVCDDLVVSTDGRGTAGVRSYWWPALGWTSESDQLNARPEDAHGRWTRLASGDGVRPGRWLLAVGSRATAGPAWVAAGVREVLTAIAGQDGAHVASDRPRRVAIPVFGVGGGGLDGQRGEVVEELLRACAAAAERHGMDVVIVARAASDYSALQSVRRRCSASGLDEHRREEAKRLSSLAREGRLALFMGAGTGVAAGLPLWAGLLSRLAAEVDLPGGPDALARLNPLDAAEVLRRALERAGGGEGSLGERVAEVIGRPPRFALSHALLATLDVDSAITTNFDDLYERAVASASGMRPRVLLPKGEQPEGGPRRWLLKLHGDAGEPETIVLDRRSFVRYDAEQRPLAAVLQSTLLTRHLFVVGASMNDDNVVRLVHEVAVLNAKRGGRAELGTVVTLQEDPLAAELWAPELRYLSVGGEAPAQESAVERDARLIAAARQLDIFLDQVAQHAAGGAAVLLDPRYSALIQDEQERRTAQKLAQIRGWIEKWAEVGEHAGEWRELLGLLGAADGRGLRSGADSSTTTIEDSRGPR